MKGSAYSPILVIESIITALLILSVVTTGLAGASAQFMKIVTMDVQTARISNAALLAQSEDLTVRSEISGYNFTYLPSESNISLEYAGKKSKHNFTRVESAYGRVNAPTTSKKIDSYICIQNRNNVLYISVDRCS